MLPWVLRNVTPVWLAALPLMVACSKSCAGEAAKLPADSRPPAHDAERPPADRADKIQLAEVEAVIASWRAAQNEGRFDEYTALYAQRFEGVKRSGERTRRFNRSGWLRDRKRMFRSPMQVQVGAPLIDLRVDHASVRFEQHWSSKDYKDRGPKELMIVREHGVLRIAREEMLNSELLARGSSLADPSNLMLVAANGLRAVIGRASDDLPVTQGAHLHQDGSAWTVSTSITSDHDREALTPFSQRAVDVLTSTGAHCPGTLAEPEAFVQVVSFQSDTPPGDAPPDAEVTPAQKLATTWKIARERWFGARVRLQAESACDGTPILARDANLDAAKVARPVDATPFSERALALARTTAPYQDIQHRYSIDHETDESWEQQTSGHVQAFRFAEEERVLVVVMFPAASCTSFGDSLWIVYAADPSGAGAYAAVGKPMANAPASVLALLDLEADQKLEFIVQDDHAISTALVSSDGTTLRSWSIDWQDCAC